jgi:MFS family permease
MKRRIELKWLLIGSLITSTSMSFIWPLNTIYMHETLHQTLTIAGLVLCANQVATMVGNWIGGIGFDRWKAYWTIVIGAGLNTLILNLLVFFNQWPIYGILIILSGFANGIAITCENSLATFVEKRKSTFVFNALYFTSNFGLVIGTLAVGYLLPLGINFVFALAGAIQVIFLVIVAMRYKVQPYQAHTDAPHVHKHVGSSNRFLLPIFIALLLSWIVYAQWQSNISAYMGGLGYSVKSYSFLWTVNAILIVLLQPLLTAANDWFDSRIRGRLMWGLGLFALSFGVLILGGHYHTLLIAMFLLTTGEVLLFPGVPGYVDLYASQTESGFFQGRVQMFSAAGNLDYSPRYLGHEIASGRSESNVWSVANTD